ncbi:MAG: polysaccharide deacetylase family protein [Muribaculaceae bacterium]|nr:polysaccharide deacetylase family protein [Muribaculaceae bacterium]
MFIEQPPLLYRILFPEAIWRINRRGRRVVYLTFDDGPVPSQTPWVLDILDRYGIRATFFMVGDNARRYPDLLEEVLRRGHSVGNHSMHHIQGVHTSTPRYLADIEEAAGYIPSSLFRPPHGIMRLAQARELRSRYNVVMYDVVTRDYSRRLTPDQVLENVCRYTRPGSIIVFHDSDKAAPNMRVALPRAIEWLLSQGYGFETLPMA